MTHVSLFVFIVVVAEPLEVPPQHEGRAGRPDLDHSSYG